MKVITVCSLNAHNIPCDTPRYDNREIIVHSEHEHCHYHFNSAASESRVFR